MSNLPAGTGPLLTDPSANGLRAAFRSKPRALADKLTTVADAVARLVHDGEDAYYITDSSLAELAATLSRTAPPLLTIVGGEDGGEPPLNRTVAVTDAGRDVLAGRRDRVACGIDRWLGGVHLRNGAVVWRWDEAQRRIVESTS